MSAPSPFVVGELPGFTPQIGRLVAMMAYARRTTLAAVEGLTTADLDHVNDERSNSIGALLAHIAAVEVAYQRATLERGGPTPAGLGRRARARCAGAAGDPRPTAGTLRLGAGGGPDAHTPRARAARRRVARCGDAVLGWAAGEQ